jgi:formate dehydrogenase major subunit
MLELRKASGPDSCLIGSSKHNNEQACCASLSFWGSNNCDHQARICHSTTVAGVANTWGYGAMTNSYNDMQNARRAVHRLQRRRGAPVSMLHMLHAKETGCKMIVVDRASRARRPRPINTCASARAPTSVPVRRAVSHLQERLGRQEVHR